MEYLDCRREKEEMPENREKKERERERERRKSYFGIYARFIYNSCLIIHFSRAHRETTVLPFGG